MTFIPSLKVGTISLEVWTDEPENFPEKTPVLAFPLFMSPEI
jgi:hypothetical protein